MPTYVYRRQDGTTFEIEQRISEDALTTCPTTGQPVSRVITGGTGLIFKGSGFYLTDYARAGGDKKSASSPAYPEKTDSTPTSPEKKEATIPSTTTETPASTASKSDKGS